MTRKLYYEDQYIRRFSAEVVSLTEFHGKNAVVLNETAFFPEGGGQSSDRGTIGSAVVDDVQIEDDVIYHIVASPDGLSVGSAVECEIDWEKRFSDMQQHSAEHIFSGIIHSLFGFENVGFHLGDTVVTLDFSSVLDHEMLEKVELLVNRTIWENHSIRAYFPTEEELKGLSFRSKKEIREALRLVEIEGVDLCACCAPHVRMTGEIGVAKIVGAEKIRGGTRISILCGDRGFADICEKMRQNKSISVLLSEKENETFKAVSKLKAEKEKADFLVNGLKSELMKAKVDLLSEAGKQLEFCDYEGDDLRRFADLLAEKANCFAAAFSGAEGAYRFVLISKTGFDLNSFFSSVLKPLGARGGGRNGIIQGSISSSKEEILSAFAEID